MGSTQHSAVTQPVDASRNRAQRLGASFGKLGTVDPSIILIAYAERSTIAGCRSTSERLWCCNVPTGRWVQGRQFQGNGRGHQDDQKESAA